MLGGFGLQFTGAVMILCEFLFGSHSPYGLQMIGGERESLRIPKLERIVLAVALLGTDRVGGAAREQSHSGSIQIAMVLLQADHDIPALVFGQLEDRRLRVKRVEQEDIQETAAVKIGESVQQTPSGRVFALSGLKPFDSQERLAEATDHLASDCPVVILQLFRFHAGLAYHDATFEAGIAATALTGEQLNTVEGCDDAAWHAAGIERLVAFECAVNLDQHVLLAFHVKAG
ncbi:MAG: hypothetical protein DMG57_01430 [Acidobacteria bacterium]|nr:MAG: hypothetical protein DMG57_01430 [Acidobacteriota bacterium]